MTTESIGIYLKKLRLEKGKTQRQLASDIKITPQAISRWENGLSVPDIDMLRILAKYYDITVDEILQASTNEKETKKPKMTGKKIWSVLIVIYVFSVLQFYFFKEPIYLLMLYTVLISAVFIFGLFFVKRYYSIYLLLITISLLFFTGYMNTQHSKYYDLNYIPAYMEVNRLNVEFDKKGIMKSTEFHYNDNHYVAAWYDAGDTLYVYNLSKGINDFETIIKLDGYSIWDVAGVTDGLYASVEEDGTDPVESKILRVNIDSQSFETISGTEKEGFASNLYAFNGFLNITDGYYGRALYIYNHKDDSFYPQKVFDVDVYDIIETTEGYIVSYCDQGACNVSATSFSFDKLYDYFDVNLGSPMELENGYQKAVAFGRDTSYFLYPNGTVKEPNIEFYQSNDLDSEIIDGNLYQNNKLVDDYSFVDQNYQREVAYLFYGESDSGYLFFSSGYVAWTRAYPRKIDHVMFDATTRELMIYGAMFSSFIILSVNTIVGFFIRRKASKKTL